jgi:hypothetical protein
MPRTAPKTQQRRAQHNVKPYEIAGAASAAPLLFVLRRRPSIECWRGSSGQLKSSTLKRWHMNADMWQWCLRALEKFALLGAPAIAILLFWKRRRVESVTLYRASWANPFCYLLWLIAMNATAILSHYTALRWMVFSSLPATLAVGLPFLSCIGSLILCLLCVGAKQVERMFVALPNLLMLILWISSVVAPN